jgi:hypothetical protein
MVVLGRGGREEGKGAGLGSLRDPSISPAVLVPRA